MSESAFQKVTREGISRNAHDAHVAGDSTESNRQLELLPYGKERPPLTNLAMYTLLVAKNSLVARFFKKEAERELDQPTEEIPVITPEMLESV